MSVISAMSDRLWPLTWPSVETQTSTLDVGVGSLTRIVFGADANTVVSSSDAGVGVCDDRISTGEFAFVAEIRGGFGDDRIVSQNGTSTISGGFGRDFIDGRDQGDTIDCGGGVDRYVKYAGDSVSNCEIAQT